MNKLVSLALGGIVATSLSMSGCVVYVQEHVRPRVIHHEHPRNDYPLLVICYEWPKRDRYCYHQNCYDRYIIKLRQNYTQHREWSRSFQYQPEKQAFPHEPKVERRGSKKPEVIEKEKTKSPRRAFPKEENPVEYQKSFKKGPN